MSETILNKIQLFTAEFQGLTEEKVKEESSIENDLNNYGDDALEYIISYGKTFKVNVSKFMAAEYFSSEGGYKLPPFISNLFKFKKTTTLKDLKIKHLVKGVELGRLDEELINSI